MSPSNDRKTLLLLGTIEVRGQEIGADPVAIQPKRTALLAFLAMAGGLVRRDTLRALLWPELDDAQARRALNQAVFHLRRALGDDAIESGGMESLALNSSIVGCDAVDFERRCAARELEPAMALYRGPFLDGFHVGELEELERWISGTRARLAAAAFSACSTLATELRERDPRSALAWARRAYEIDPGDAAIRRVIALRDSLGDRSGAIREYEQFARRIADELDVEPSPETRRLADEIRARGEPVAAVATRSLDESPALDAPHTPSTPHAPMPVRAAAPIIPPRRRTKLMASVVAAVLVIGAIASFTVAHRPAVDAGSLTNSREALASYRAGERDLAAGRFESAVENFRRATIADSGYAMAQYRLSVAANWTGQTVLSNSAAAHAQETASALPPNDRSRIEAWSYYLRGETVAAERLYTKLLAADPSDFDAAFYLAEIKFHWGPGFGSSAPASAPAWDQVLALQPGNAGAIIHRLRIAAMDRDSATFESLAARLAALNPSADHQTEVRVLRAFTFGDSASRASATAEVASVDALRRSLVHEALLSARDMRGAAKQLIPTLLIGQTFASFEQGEFLLGAQTSAATGHVAEALATIDSAAVLQPDRAIEYRAMMASIMGLALPEGFRASVRRELDGPLSPQTAYSSAQPTRDYFAAILAVRDGDLRVARQKLELLRTRNPPGAGYDTTVARVVDRLSRIAGAEIARAAGKPDSALVLLGEPELEPDRRIPYVWSLPRAEERLLRGDLLARTGHPKEALAWLATFPDPGTYDIAYLPAALALRAEVAARIGDRKSIDETRALLASLGSGGGAGARR